MAQRRMIAKTIIDSDAFLDMPQSTQLLYFHLSIRADDDGFLNNTKSIMRNVGCKDDDLKILAAKKFIIPFENGVVVIKHWKINNYIAKDRHTPTKYQNELSSLNLDENNAYSQSMDTTYTRCIQDVHKCETQVRLGKVRLGKERGSTAKDTHHATGVPINQTTYETLCEEYGESTADAYIQRAVDYVAAKGRTPYKDYAAAIRQWMRKDESEGKLQRQRKYVPADNPYAGLPDAAS